MCELIRLMNWWGGALEPILLDTAEIVFCDTLRGQPERVRATIRLRSGSTLIVEETVEQIQSLIQQAHKNAPPPAEAEDGASIPRSKA